MVADSNIYKYDEPKVILNSARSISTFFKSVESIIVLILAVPVLILVLLFYYPILMLGLTYLKSKSRKLLEETKAEFNSLTAEDAKIFIDKVEHTIHSLRKISPEEEISETIFIRKIESLTSEICKNFKAIQDIGIASIYTDTSKKEYSEEEQKIFSDLSDFFGDDEDGVYMKDTFDQLNPKGV